MPIAQEKLDTLRWVSGDGPGSTDLMIVGEAPGKDEDEQGRCFVGASGRLLESALQEANTSRNQCYITNVVKVRPPDNKLDRLPELGVTLSDFSEYLWDEISSVKPNAILALGETAFNELTGKKGIGKWRGSILPSKQGYPKVIGTLHPANFLHESDSAGGIHKWSQWAYVKLDIQRAIYQSTFKDIILPKRSLWVCRDSLSLMRFLDRNKQRNIVAVDIETLQANPICIGLSFHPSEAVSIPLLDSEIGTDELRHIWIMITDLLYDSKIKKIGQNFKFDERCLRDFGFPVRGLYSDTMLKGHCIYAEWPKSLQFLTSIYTDEPYYKDEGRLYNPKKDTFDQLLLYNAKDAALTIEVNELLEKEITEFGNHEYFYSFEMRLHDLYMFIEDCGILVDEAQRQKIILKYQEKRDKIQKELNEAVGFEINVDSNPQVCTLLYEELRCPKRLRIRYKGHSTLSADEEAIDSLLANVIKDERRRKILHDIKDIRGCNKTLGTYLGVPKPGRKSKLERRFQDDDGRVRTSYLITGTENNRTSTNLLDPPVRPYVAGLAFQTISKHSEEGMDVRSVLIPSEGCCFLEVDKSQAEARVVLNLAEEYETLKKMDELDIHILTGSWVAGWTYDQLITYIKATKDENYRQLGKVVRHGGGYAMKKKRLRETAFDYGLEISEWYANQVLEIFHRFSPGIQQTFHKGIQDCLAIDRTLTAPPFWRKRIFLEKWGEDLFKEAYSSIPQTVVSDHTKHNALTIHQEFPEIGILLEGHDSLLFEFPMWRLDYYAPRIKEIFEESIDFSKCSLPRPSLVIPCEMKVSFSRLSEMEKYAVK